MDGNPLGTREQAWVRKYNHDHSKCLTECEPDEVVWGTPVWAIEGITFEETVARERDHQKQTLMAKRYSDDFERWLDAALHGLANLALKGGKDAAS